jgi:hypothetical protein
MTKHIRKMWMISTLFLINTFIFSELPAASLQPTDQSQHWINLTCSDHDINLLTKHSILSSDVRLSEESQCPQTLWLDEMLQTSFNTHDNTRIPIGISVGCNTGMDAIGSARSLSKNRLFSKSKWLSQIENASQSDLIAKCRSRKSKKQGFHADFGEIDLHPETIPKPIEFHCIEPIDTTFRALQQSSTRLGLVNHGFHIHQYVISNSSGSITFPRGKWEWKITASILVRNQEFVSVWAVNKYP